MKNRLCFASVLVALSLISCTPLYEPVSDSVEEAVAGKDYSYDFPANSSIAVTRVSARRSWTIEYDNPSDTLWLSFSPSSGSRGSELVSITAADNCSDKVRTASLRLKIDNASSRITVTQKGADIIASADKEYHFSFYADTLSLDVIYDKEYSIDVSDRWVGLAGQIPGKSGKLVFAIAKNGTKTVRYADIYLTGVDKQQIIRIVQMPTAHPPRDAKEIKASVEMTDNLGKQLNPILKDVRSSDTEQVRNAITRIAGLEDVLNVVQSSSKNIIAVQQKDSLWINCFIDQESDDFPDELSAVVNARVNALCASVPKHDKKALILAPFSRCEEDWLVFDKAHYVESLEMAGFRSSNINVRQDPDIEYSEFLSEKQDDYDLIIVRTHGGTGYYDFSNVIESPCFSTNIDYTSEALEDFYEKGILTPKTVGIAQLHSGRLIFLVTPPSFGDTPLTKSPIVFLGACHSAELYDGSKVYENSMFSKYLENGASAVTGWSGTIDSRVSDLSFKEIVRLMASSLSLKEATDYVRTCSAMDQYCEDYKAYLTEKGSDADLSAVDQRLMHTEGSSVDELYLVEPYITLCETDARNAPIGLSWNTNLESFSVAFPKVTPKKNSKGGMSFSTTDEQYDYIRINEIFVDGERVARTMGSVTSCGWTPSSGGSHSWMVSSYIRDGDEVISRFDSATSWFVYSGAYIKVISGDAVTLPASGGKFTVEVESNVDYSVSTSCSWFKEYESVKSGNTMTHVFKCNPNTVAKSREGSIEFYDSSAKVCRSVTVTQEAAMVPEQWETRDFWHRSFIMYFTSSGCAYSPAKMSTLKEAVQKRSNKAEIMSVYFRSGVGSLAVSGTGPSILEEYGIQAYPDYLIDGQKYSGQLGYGSDDIANLMEEIESKQKTSSGIGVSSHLDDSSLEVDITLCFKDYGDYKVSAFVTENGIIEYQSGYGEAYCHDFVMRRSLSGALGDKLTLYRCNETKELQYHTAVDSKWDISNLRILVFVQKETGTHSITYNSWNYPDRYCGSYVDNVVSAPVGKLKPVSLVNTQNSDIEDVLSGADIDFN